MAVRNGPHAELIGENWGGMDAGGGPENGAEAGGGRGCGLREESFEFDRGRQTQRLD